MAGCYWQSASDPLTQTPPHEHSRIPVGNTQSIGMYAQPRVSPR